MPQLLGIDLGTSSVKVAVIDADSLRVLADADAEYPIRHPQVNYAEQSPTEWWSATVTATRNVLQTVESRDVIAIGLSGQMHGFIPLDATHEPSHPAIIWADGRSSEQVQELLQFAETSPSTIPGYPAMGFAGSSALWLKQHKPEILSQMSKWCLPKDYLRLKLTGIIATEASDASSTWLFDVKKSAWAEDVASFCGLSPEQMPNVVASHAVSGQLTQQSAEELGLSAGIPVVGGSADLPAQALGYGINDPSTLLITVGSGGQVFLPSNDPVIQENSPSYLFNHNVPNTWYTQTSILTAGLVMRWLRDFVGMQSQDDAYAHLSSLAETIEAGSDGLLLLPYLAGERNPNPDANANGAVIGLRLNHEKAHFARAIMEGVCFAIKESLSHVPNHAETYLLAGGITNSLVWCQILADVLDHDLEIPTGTQSFGCVGVAILAGIGCGYFDSFEDAFQRQEISTSIFSPKKPERYHIPYQHFLRAYQFLKS